MIRRRNILDLIGKHRGKYHSCVLTCYSFDFSFFEERVLPTLRLANIKNVNVLADGHYLEMAQEATTGREFKHNKTYNFHPIYETGVFHPKIILLTGVRHGLLIIGSGNITSSGLSTNDEIWGAFHLDNIGNENAPLFGAAWEYLKPFLDKSLGFIPQKIEWMKKHSPWLNDLPVTSDWIKLKSLGLEVKFLVNSNNNSIFSQLSANIPSTDVDKLTIISPYFDKSGAQVKQLISLFSPQQTSCLVDINSGTVPSELDDEYRIDYYDWAECRDDYDNTFNRLHAKLFHFVGDNTEHLLLGSPNATIAALGLGNSNAANAEAAILLRRNTTESTLLEDLKIKLPQQTVNVKGVNSNGITEGSIKRIKYEYRILYSELRSNELTIFLKEGDIDLNMISVLDRNENRIDSKIKEVKENIITVYVTNPDDVFKIYVESEGVRISNYSIVHRLEGLLRCNPDPNQEKLDALLEHDFIDGEGITDLLQFIDYNWADDQSESIKKVFNHSTGAVRTATENKDDKEYEVLDAKQFNKVSTESLLRQSGELSNSTVKIAEFLSLFSSGMVMGNDEFRESEEQRLYEDEQQQGQGDEVDKKSKRVKGSKEKTAISKYFKKLDSVYSASISTFIKSRVTNDLQGDKITIRSLSSILIAIHLIYLKFGKKFTVLTSELDQGGEFVTKEETYLSAGSKSESVDTVKGFLINVFGKFLLVSASGYKKYEYEILNQKLSKSREQLFLKSVLLILNTSWKSSEIKDRDILLLNCLYFIIGEQILLKEFLDDLTTKLQDLKSKTSFVSSEFDEQMVWFEDNLLKDYIKWYAAFNDPKNERKKLITPVSKLGYGNILFNSKIGFNFIKKVNASEHTCKLNLSRCGYPFTDGDVELTKIQFGSKVVVYF